jgi:hypothetical protein
MRTSRKGIESSFFISIVNLMCGEVFLRWLKKSSMREGHETK